MTRRKKILTGTLAVLVLALGVLAFAISHNSPCDSAAAPEGQAQMRAVLYRCYGAPDVLRLEATAKPVAADDEVLVKVHAASVNPLDWHYMRGEPYVMRLGSGMGAPDDHRMGWTSQAPWRPPAGMSSDSKRAMPCSAARAVRSVST